MTGSLLQERIAGCEKQLQQLDEQVVSLKAEFESKKGLEIELKSSLAKAEATLNAATTLLDKLAEEKSRWEGQVCLLCTTCRYRYHFIQSSPTLFDRTCHYWTPDLTWNH